MTASIAHITQPMLGERVNGDAVVIRDEGAALMLAVIDGLGHGPIAAEAAQLAATALAGQSLQLSVLEMIKNVHDRLRGSRGVAATICLIRNQRVEACAVGNVQLSSSNATVPLVLSPGVLGARVAKYHVCQGTLKPGARLALFSDGISSRVAWDDVRKLPPESACRHVFARFRKKEDDATILIADIDHQVTA
jgi:negative regulator of sigma-B (phosphoserine phosphatase)